MNSTYSTKFHSQTGRSYPKEAKKKTPKTERKQNLTPVDIEYYKQRFKFQKRMFKPCFIRLYYHTRNGQPEWYERWQAALLQANPVKTTQNVPEPISRSKALYNEYEHRPKLKQKIRSLYNLPRHITSVSDLRYSLLFY